MSIATGFCQSWLTLFMGKEKMMEWQEIATAPKDRPIHVYDPRHSFTATIPRLVQWNGLGWHRLDRHGFINMYVPATHWREVPSPTQPM